MHIAFWVKNCHRIGINRSFTCRGLLKENKAWVQIGKWLLSSNWLLGINNLEKSYWSNIWRPFMQQITTVTINIFPTYNITTRVMFTWKFFELMMKILWFISSIVAIFPSPICPNISYYRYCWISKSILFPSNLKTVINFTIDRQLIFP